MNDSQYNSECLHSESNASHSSLGRGQSGKSPKTLDIPAFTPVANFAEVTPSGNSSLTTLTREQLDETTILDSNNHRTVKLATTCIPKLNWTNDISRIEVKE